MHGGPATESHFKLTVVSDEFQDVALVKRHQLVYKILKEEISLLEQDAEKFKSLKK